jgi:hypothetical protein
MGFKAPFLVNIKSNLSFGIKLDLWKQPLFLGPEKALQNSDNLLFYDFKEEDLKKEHIGGSLSMLTTYQIKTSLFFDGILGYKTAGFVPGEPLKRSLLFKIGMGGTF